jgi:hypothetical protein
MRVMGRKIIKVSRVKQTIKEQIVSSKSIPSKGGGRKAEKTH